ncbi:MAG: GreA/GreB family elongation factor [Deltaproteobacteria bacterium]|nr:GreA/GreB family elongation factor [Deltaproteobacteria bacterium]
MSRAFVNEDLQSEAQAELPERPQSEHPNYVTPQGLAALKRRLATLVAERSALSDDADEIRSQAARQRIDRNARYLSARIDRAILVDLDAQPRDEVAFGASVRVCDSDGEERVFSIVGEDEADAAAGKVSWVSPLANALLGARVDDVVTWRRPNGNLELEILSIDYASSEASSSPGKDCDL